MWDRHSGVSFFWGVALCGSAPNVMAPTGFLILLTAMSVGIADADARFVRPSPKDGWEIWEVRDAQAVATVHVRRSGDRALPLVVFAGGSHCLPVFFRSADGDGNWRERSTLPFAVEEAQRLADFHFAVVERKGLQSFSEVAEIPRSSGCTQERGGVHKEERAYHIALASRTLHAEPWVSSVLLTGHSEGAEVASGALRFVPDDHVAAVGFLASGGISQFFDLVLRARRNGDAAGRSESSKSC